MYTCTVVILWLKRLWERPSVLFSSLVQEHFCIKYDVNEIGNCKKKPKKKTIYINVRIKVLVFECPFQPIWMLHSGDIVIFPKEVTGPIAPLFR